MDSKARMLQSRRGKKKPAASQRKAACYVGLTEEVVFRHIGGESIRRKDSRWVSGVCKVKSVGTRS